MSEDDHDSNADEAADGDASADIEADPFDDIEAADGEPIDDPFTEVEVDDIDEDDVWAEITGEEAETEGEAETEAEPELETAGDAEPAFEAPETGDTEGDEVIVEKSSYCQQCEYFSEPPGVSCTHPGTDIIELVDTERFRVRNCPVVKRRRGTTEEVLED